MGWGIGARDWELVVVRRGDVQIYHIYILNRWDHTSLDARSDLLLYRLSPFLPTNSIAMT